MIGNDEQFLNEVTGLSNYPCIDIKISPLAAFFLTTHVQLSCRHPSITGDQITIVRGVIDQLIESLRISREFKLHLQKGWHPEFKLTIPQASVERAKETAFSVFCHEWKVKPEWETYFKTEVTKDNEIVISVIELPELTFTLLVDQDGAPDGFKVGLESRFILDNPTKNLDSEFEKTAQQIIKNKLAAFPLDLQSWLEKVLLQILKNIECQEERIVVGTFDNTILSVPNNPHYIQVNKRAFVTEVVTRNLMSEFIAEMTGQTNSSVQQDFATSAFEYVMTRTEEQINEAIKAIAPNSKTTI